MCHVFFTDHFHLFYKLSLIKITLHLWTFSWLKPDTHISHFHLFASLKHLFSGSHLDTNADVKTSGEEGSCLRNVLLKWKISRQWKKFKNCFSDCREGWAHSVRMCIISLLDLTSDFICWKTVQVYFLSAFMTVPLKLFSQKLVPHLGRPSSTVTPRSYVVGGSKNGDASWDWFCHQRYVKIARAVPHHLFLPIKLYVWTYEEFTKKWNLTDKRLFKADTCFWTVGMSFGSSYPVSKIQVAMYKSLKMTWRNQALKSGETKTSSFPSDSPPGKQESS